MKAISPIIAIIIILLITIAIAGAGYSYISVYWTGLMSKQIQILDASCYPGNQGKILIRNIGTTKINTSEIRVLNSQTGVDITGDVLWSSNVSDPDLVLEMKFDEGSGITATDTSGQGNDGTLKNATGAACFTNGACPEWIDGKAGGALEFDGDGDYVDCGNDMSLDVTDKVTISAWIKTNSISSGYKVIVNKYYPPLSGGGWGLYQNAQDMYFFGRNSADDNYGYAHKTGTISTGEWYHIVGVFKPQLYELYINGVLEDDTSVAWNSLYSNSEDVRIGVDAYNDDHSFNGIIDEVRIYNRALSEDEIKSLSSNSFIINQSQTAVLTHTCTGTCSYSLVLPSGAKEAMLAC